MISFYLLATASLSFNAEAFQVTQFTFLPSQQQRCSRTALFEKPERVEYSIIYECDTIDSLEERWVDALQQHMNMTAIAWKRTTQLIVADEKQQREQFAQTIAFLQKILAAMDEQIENDREDYPVNAMASGLEILLRLVFLKKAELNHTELKAYAKKWLYKLSGHSKEFVATQGPNRCSKVFRMMSMLGEYKSELYEAISRKLAQKSTVARIKKAEIAQIILCFDNLDRKLQDHDLVLLKWILRRAREPDIRSTMQRNMLVRLLKVMRKLLDLSPRWDKASTDVLRLTCYSYMAQLVEFYEIAESDPVCPSEAHLLWVISREVTLHQENPLFVRITNLLEANSAHLIERSTLLELALLSDVSLLSAKFKMTPIFRHIGHVLQNDSTVVSGEVPPWVVTKVLRCVARSIAEMETRDAAATDSDLLAQPHLSDNSRESLILPFQKVLADLLQRPDFVMKLSGAQIQHYLFILHRFRLYNKNLIFALANRIIDPGVSSRCSSKVACLALGWFTDLFSLSDEWDDPGDEAERDELFSRISSVLGDRFLILNMTASDISPPLYAYGKAGYDGQEMSVFDDPFFKWPIVFVRTMRQLRYARLHKRLWLVAGCDTT
ncbi:hypothetical protein FisN_35Hu048 [Fistulifera solaris]|uniref:PH domain-containing protein n=1 Tax=Fistulifera solaris TaxID=1519565 RepID=A0A1Z5JQQ2_FISSO|nr:hypothetical protein FisN_35Hu048 [Fistulifera solaris]|eukprot:GAX16344.1 hypothetical protein FisN_35Hu048 [Fistulifera solaris]